MALPALIVQLLILAIYLVHIGVHAKSSDLRKNLNYFEVLHTKQFGHNIVKRGTQPSNHPFNKIREVNFKALGRDFRLILSPKKGEVFPQKNSSNGQIISYV